jgi:hypothetical protein
MPDQQLLGDPAVPSGRGDRQVPPCAGNRSGGHPRRCQRLP